MGVQTEMLQTVLCFRAISSASARNTQYQKPNSVEEANSARDAFICGAYDRLFLWLVEAINKAMPTSGDGCAHFSFFWVRNAFLTDNYRPV